ncbi:hypothetical protein BDP27DRAFT_917201 [Rhodocollybia butyracea]|uniref:Zn(2)-C6 fungal-type domain-containing protein n=1 Tax=Rhodocollybia butyracea TaxID=206335 RepID=A0A9P5P417_9AGAR|nr:hypothetical protein BDP27DRAFT_917201 [Rhodocollybia butyracea]
MIFELLTLHTFVDCHKPFFSISMPLHTLIAFTPTAAPDPAKDLRLEAQRRGEGRTGRIAAFAACDTCWEKKRKCEIIKGRPDTCRGCKYNKAGPCTFYRFIPRSPTTIIPGKDIPDKDGFVMVAPCSGWNYKDYIKASTTTGCRRCHSNPCSCLRDYCIRWDGLRSSVENIGRQKGCFNCGVRYSIKWRRSPTNQINCNLPTNPTKL